MASPEEIAEASAVIDRLKDMFGPTAGPSMYWKFQGRKSYGHKMPVEVFTEVLSSIPDNIDKDRQRRFYLHSINEAWKKFDLNQERSGIRETYDKLRKL